MPQYLKEAKNSNILFSESQLRILLILSTYKLYLSTCGDGGDWEVHLSLLAIAEVFLKDGFVQGTFLNVS